MTKSAQSQNWETWKPLPRQVHGYPYSSCSICKYIHQVTIVSKLSINQSNFYSANIPGVARLSGATARSVFKYKVVEAIP